MIVLHDRTTNVMKDIVATIFVVSQKVLEVVEAVKTTIVYVIVVITSLLFKAIETQKQVTLTWHYG